MRKPPQYVYFKLTWDDIKNGVPGNTNSCPIARRAGKAYPSACDGRPNVNGETIRLYGRLYKLGAKASRFIGNFDWGKRNACRPGTYSARLVSERNEENYYD